VGIDILEVLGSHLRTWHFSQRKQEKA